MEPSWPRFKRRNSGRAQQRSTLPNGAPFLVGYKNKNWNIATLPNAILAMNRKLLAGCLLLVVFVSLFLLCRIQFRFLHPGKLMLVCTIRRVALLAHNDKSGLAFDLSSLSSFINC